LQTPKHDAKIHREQSDYRLCLLVEKEQELYLGMLTVSPELQNSGLGKNYCNRQKFMHRHWACPKL
jgi:ribosomal protein S18 acetylase RimI-like enzyme